MRKPKKKFTKVGKKDCSVTSRPSVVSKNVQNSIICFEPWDTLQLKGNSDATKLAFKTLHSSTSLKCLCHTFLRDASSSRSDTSRRYIVRRCRPWADKALRYTRVAQGVACGTRTASNPSDQPSACPSAGTCLRESTRTRLSQSFEGSFGLAAASDD